MSSTLKSRLLSSGDMEAIRNEGVSVSDLIAALDAPKGAIQPDSFRIRDFRANYIPEAGESTSPDQIREGLIRAAREVLNLAIARHIFEGKIAKVHENPNDLDSALIVAPVREVVITTRGITLRVIINGEMEERGAAETFYANATTMPIAEESIQEQQAAAE